MSVDLQLPAVSTDCDVRLFPIARRLARFSYAPALGKALSRAVQAADLVHIHALFLYPTYAAFRAASDAGKPFLVSPYGSLDPWIRSRGWARKTVAHAAWQGRLFREAAGVLAATPEEAALWPAYARRPPVHVVPYGIELAEFRDVPSGRTFRAELGIRPDQPLIVNVGRIAAKKGLDTLICATANLHREGILAHLALVGPDDEGLGPHLRALAESEQIRQYVHFMGFREGSTKLDAFAAADVWALPSHTENFGIAVLEALAVGKAVLISSAVNLAPQIAAAGAGIVRSPSVEATTEGLRAILVDAELRSSLEAKSRPFARQFDWSTVAARMHDVYRTVLQSRSEKGHSTSTRRARGWIASAHSLPYRWERRCVPRQSA